MKLLKTALLAAGLAALGACSGGADNNAAAANNVVEDVTNVSDEGLVDNGLNESVDANAAVVTDNAVVANETGNAQ